MTAVHRTDVRRLTRDQAVEPVMRPSSSLMKRIIDSWTGSKEFVDGTGAPRPLPRRRSSGDAIENQVPSFDDLVESVTKGVPVRALVVDWVRLGALHVNDDGDICLTAPANAANDLQFRVERGFRFAADRMNAVVENELVGSQEHFLRVAVGTGLSRSAVDQLRQEAEQIGTRACRQLNQLIVKLEAEGNPDAESYRFVFPVNSYHEQEPPDEP